MSLLFVVRAMPGLHIVLLYYLLGLVLGPFTNS
jgi:hypothetical protein